MSRLAPDVVASGADDAAQPRFADAKAKGVWFSPVYFRNYVRTLYDDRGRACRPSMPG